MEVGFDFSKRFTPARKKQFAEVLQEIQSRINFKVSARGWCYLMEQAGYINKSQFDRVADAINDLRRQGLIPVDFVAEEKAREFEGVKVPTEHPISETLTERLRWVLQGHLYHMPQWWEDEEYYIQMIVEKIDLVSLFEPICREYNIPIANSKGWSSILQRAEYARRFKEAEDKGLKCVLLYCGDHDPDGLRISDTLRANLEQVAEVSWEDGEEGYNPAELIIDRFGLNYDFIIRNDYTWIDNLVTGSGKNLNDPKHVNHNMVYVQDYLKTVGPRKCEANAIVTTPKAAEELCRRAIEGYIGSDALERFSDKRREVRLAYQELLDKGNMREPIEKFIGRDVDNDGGDDDDQDDDY